MYLVTVRIQLGAVSPIVLTISPLFPIHSPSFQSHSRHLRRLSVAGHIARCQLSSRVSYKSFSAVSSPVWLERPIRQLPFPRFRSRSAPPPANPQLLVSRSRIVGTQCITTCHIPTPHGITPPLPWCCPVVSMPGPLCQHCWHSLHRCPGLRPIIFTID